VSCHLRPLFDNGRTTIARSICDGQDPPRPVTRQTVEHKMVVTLRGRFSVRHRAGQAIFDPTRAVMERAGDEYVSRHPEGGDECLSLASDLLIATFDSWQSVSLPVPAQVRLHDLAARLGAGAADVLEVEEALADIFDPDAQRRRRGTSRARALADQIAHEVAVRFNQPLPLDLLASQVGVSPFAACRLFRSTTGWTIHQYQLELRLRHALTLLFETEHPLAAIALETGFANQGHFGNHFRRRYGLTPGQARTTDGKKALAATDSCKDV
jgi:AraC family transcriptional regulator